MSLLPYPYVSSGIVHAQPMLDDIILGADTIIRLLIPVAAGVCVLLFIWGLALFILRSGDEKQLAAGRRRMIWGVIGLFCMVAIWGIVGYLSGLLGTATGGSCPPPQIGANKTTTCF